MWRKSQITECKKYFTNYTSDKGIIPKIYIKTSTNWISREKKESSQKKHKWVRNY